MKVFSEKDLKIFLLFALMILLAPYTAAESGYVSPESYAVNEADLNDYMDVAPSPKLNIDDLDKPLKTKLKSRPRKAKTEN